MKSEVAIVALLFKRFTEGVRGARPFKVCKYGDPTQTSLDWCDVANWVFSGSRATC